MYSKILKMYTSGPQLSNEYLYFGSCESKTWQMNHESVFFTKYLVECKRTNLVVYMAPWSGRTRHDLFRWQLLHGNRTTCLPSVLRPSRCCQSPSHQVSPCTATSILITHLHFRIHRSINIYIGAQIMMLCDGFMWVQFVLLLWNVNGSWQIKLSRNCSI